MTQLATTMLDTPIRICMQTEMKRVETAYNKLGIREPFIAAVMSKVKRSVVSNDPRITTAATNGAWVKYAAEFTATVSDPQLFGLVLHESMHVILMHMWRRGDRHPGLWNYANDGIINKYIRDRGYELPEGGVHIKWVTDQMDSEEVYRRCKDELPEPPPPPPGGEGDDEGDDTGSGGDGDDGDPGDDDGSGGGGNEMGADDPSSGGGGGAPQPGGDGNDGIPRGGFGNSGDLLDAEDEATKADLEATIVAAAQMAKQCGQGSALVDRILDTIGKPTVAWDDALRDMLNAVARGDFSYRRLAKRYLWQNVAMPAMYEDSLGGLLVGFDTSGSVSQAEANQIAAEITAIANDLQPEFVEVVYCDARITKIERFEQGEDVKLAPNGGGGTAFEPVFDYLENSEEDFAGMIYFTDMCANLSRLRQPEIPMIWANTCDYGKSVEVPFGIVVNVEL